MSMNVKIREKVYEAIIESDIFTDFGYEFAEAAYCYDKVVNKDYRTPPVWNIYIVHPHGSIDELIGIGYIDDIGLLKIYTAIDQIVFKEFRLAEKIGKIKRSGENEYVITDVYGNKIAVIKEVNEE